MGGTKATATVFHAVADPTRRAILDLLAGGEKTVSELVEQFSMSQPAISQHLKILLDAGLVTVRPEGRLRYYEACPGPLREIHDWVAHYRKFWKRKLDALEAYLEKNDET